MKKPNNHVTPSKGRRAMILLRPFLWREKNEAGLCNSPTASQAQRIIKYYRVSQLLVSFEIQQSHSCLGLKCAIISVVYISNHGFCEKKKKREKFTLTLQESRDCCHIWRIFFQRLRKEELRTTQNWPAEKTSKWSITLWSNTLQWLKRAGVTMALTIRRLLLILSSLSYQ